MTVLSACQKAAVKLVGRRPSTIYSSTEPFELELQDLATEVGEDIAKTHDWQALQKTHTIVGDGSSVTFSLPADYARMLIKTDFIESSSGARWQRFDDINAFLALGNQTGVSPGGWIVYGDLLHFAPAPALDATVIFPYIDKNIVIAADLVTLKPAFTIDNDSFRLSERLLQLGITWKWRSNKKLDYADDESAFSKAFAEDSGRDKGSRIIITGPRRFPANVTVAYPWQLG